MSLSQKLEAERRARLAAERLLAHKRRELTEANRKLGLHARELTEEITATRAHAASIEDENLRVRSALGEAQQKIALVEGQLLQALGAARDGFALWSASGRLELANRAYLSVFDGLASAGVGAHYTHLVDLMVEEGIADLEGADAGSWRARIHAGWEDRDPAPVTIRLFNGAFIKLHNRRTPDGGVVSLVVDMTDLMRLWSAVQELPDGFVLFDAEDRLVTCNPRYREIYAACAPILQPGADYQDILRYGLDHGQFPEASGREAAWLAERLRARRAAETVHEQELGGDRWLRVLERRGADGGTVGLLVDISEQKAVQRDLGLASERAEAANRAKSAFLANISHEIRTPMNGVVGMTDLLLETRLDEDQGELVETIRNSGEALLGIINDVLDYSKIEASKMTLRSVPFDLERTVHEVCLLVQPAARDKGLALLVDYDMFLPTAFLGDAARMRQILTNLLGNAVKFTARGHVLVRVVGVPEPSGRVALHLTVEDTGIGIAPDKQAHVFGEFNQVEDDHDRSFEGTGLGLAISKRLVELMQGEIWVDSELGQGACFGVRVVLDAVEPPSHAVPRLPAALHRLMVVDPNDSNRAILGRQLAVAGAECAMFGSGAAALANPDRYDAVLVAQDLDDMAWPDLVRQIDARRRGVPVVLLAGGGGPAPGAAQVAAVVRTPAPRRALFAALAGLPDAAAGGAAGAAGSGTGAGGGAEAGPAFVSRRGGPAAGLLFRHRGGAPLAANAAAPAGPAAPVAASGMAERAGPVAPIDLLVAEDNLVNQRVFSGMLSGVPVRPRFAANGADAVTAFAARRPDLIFMDISMPHMDGREATRRIRALEAESGARPVPIVAVTAHALEDDRTALLAGGLDDYLSKPLRKAALLDMLRRHGGLAADGGAEDGGAEDQPAARRKAGRSGVESSASKA
ncbi:PAS-domain containing protein [Roseivivax sp. CAU 1761]